jgi:type IV secretory pathway TrbL component
MKKEKYSEWFYTAMSVVMMIAMYAFIHYNFIA